MSVQEMAFTYCDVDECYWNEARNIEAMLPDTPAAEARLQIEVCVMRIEKFLAVRRAAYEEIKR